jgi:hypothetical protein
MIRYVDSDSELDIWRDRVTAADGLHAYARLTLLGIATLTDRSTWRADVTKSLVADHLKVARTTLHPHWTPAIESGYVRQVGSHEYVAGNRVMYGPTLRLVLPSATK